MKLSISNIAWSKEQDETIYSLMKQNGFTGLEIAPTRWFPDKPYERMEDARELLYQLKKEYSFQISSMQSIWYGKKENIWSSTEERQELEKYTKKAIDFAAALECGNLVFGCPKNRNRVEGTDETEIIQFFRRLGDYASTKHTVISLEANPSIYHTNYLNRTEEALVLARSVGSAGIGINLDVGSMIVNEENVNSLGKIWPYINHVHISEPGLAAITNRKLHERIARILELRGYDKFISIEMGLQSNLAVIKDSMVYVKEIFG